MCTAPCGLKFSKSCLTLCLAHHSRFLSNFPHVTTNIHTCKSPVSCHSEFGQCMYIIQHTYVHVCMYQCVWLFSIHMYVSVCLLPVYICMYQCVCYRRTYVCISVFVIRHTYVCISVFVIRHTCTYVSVCLLGTLVSNNVDMPSHTCTCRFTCHFKFGRAHMRVMQCHAFCKFGYMYILYCYMPDHIWSHCVYTCSAKFSPLCNIDVSRRELFSVCVCTQPPAH